MNSTRSFARGMAARSVLAALLTAFVALAGTACGQRGPLYLPDSAPAPESVTPAEDAAPGKDPEAADTAADPKEDEDRE